MRLVEIYRDVTVIPGHDAIHLEIAQCVENDGKIE